MHSIPMAMIWELWSRSKWEFLLVALSVLILPVLTIGVLRLEYALDLQDASIQMFHFVLISMQAIGCAGIVLQPPAHPSRLYGWPISTPELVFWHQLPAAVAAALMYLASAGVLDLLFGTNWPLLGPTLFVAVAIMAAQAILWLTRHNLLLQVASLWTTGIALLSWLMARFHGLGAPRGVGDRSEHRLWTDVTSGELFTLGIIAACAYATAVYAVRRDRRGDTLAWPWIAGWFNRRTAPGARSAAPFRSATSADFWREWRQAGWILPAAALALCSVICIVRLFSEDPGMLAMAQLLPVFGFVGGTLHGNTSAELKRSPMGGFLATRPITDREMAATTLKSTTVGVFLALLIWLPFFLWLKTTLPETPRFAREAVIFTGIGVIVATWLTTAISACAIMTGRPAVLGAIFGGLCAVMTVGIFVQNYIIPAGYQELTARFEWNAVGTLFFGGTVFLFFAAWRRSLIGVRTIAAAVLVWGALFAGASELLSRLHAIAHSDPIVAVIGGGVLALAVAPLAAAPLAIHLNRHR